MKLRKKEFLLLGLSLTMLFVSAVGCGTVATVKNGTSQTGDSEGGTKYYYSTSWEDQIKMAEKTSEKVSSVAEANSKAPDAIKGKVKQPSDTLGASTESIFISEGSGDAAMATPPSVVIVYSNHMTVEARQSDVTQNYPAMVDYMRSLEEQGYGKHSSQVFSIKVGDYDGIALEPGFNQSTGGPDEAYPGYVKWQVGNTEYAVFGNCTVADLLKVANSM